MRSAEAASATRRLTSEAEPTAARSPRTWPGRVESPRPRSMTRRCRGGFGGGSGRRASRTITGTNPAKPARATPSASAIGIVAAWSATTVRAVDTVTPTDASRDARARRDASLGAAPAASKAPRTTPPATHRATPRNARRRVTDPTGAPPPPPSLVGKPTPVVRPGCTRSFVWRAPPLPGGARHITR